MAEKKILKVGVRLRSRLGGIHVETNKQISTNKQNISTNKQNKQSQVTNVFAIPLGSGRSGGSSQSQKGQHGEESLALL